MTEPTTHDAVAEQSVLGAMLISRDAIPDIADILDGGDFYRPAHETIYRTILDLHGSGNPVDAITVNDALTQMGEIARVGGVMYAHELAGIVHSAASGAYYAEIVAHAATRRRLTAAGRKIQDLAGNGGDVDELVEAARREVDQTSRATGSTVSFFGETIDAMLGTLDEEINHHPTPWAALNDIIGGLRPGALYVVAARPSVGKSVIALNLAQGLLEHGSVAFSSLEMSNNDVQIRAVSSDLNLDVSRLIERNLTPGDWARIRDRRAVWGDVPLAVDDRSGVTITDIKRFARSVNRRKPLAGIVVDYLQLMSQPHGDKRPRHEFVADMSRQLKIMAMDMQVPVIALSQLNRGSTQREDKMPQISDMRESGAIEQDADVVILLHREIMGDNRNDLSMLVAKNRHGATGLAELQFWGHYSKALDRGLTPQAALRQAA
ncbi:replicative DNA helicase [Pseudarthrobacter sp. NIBRBAC000502772]|uniref:replicative DNA helicase n=1 Tax=Pseudarthrobacter sp. NIBRBAC000502772 TaxID=2590775 RepID=UPI0011320E1B|nr:replicative DNA helicase [Pseudarthrobacter sp. NIBRBAC000502772]QDG65828.1 replicative DNA helicase [Pseudarthrobacter sp. NIBRBAC000502772]